MLSVGRRDIASLVRGKPRPTGETASTEAQSSLDKAIADYEKANEDLYAILSLLTEQPAALVVDKHEDSTGTNGGGKQTLQKLVNKYSKDRNKQPRVYWRPRPAE